LCRQQIFLSPFLFLYLSLSLARMHAHALALSLQSFTDPWRRQPHLPPLSRSLSLSLFLFLSRSLDFDLSLPHTHTHINSFSVIHPDSLPISRSLALFVCRSLLSVYWSLLGEVSLCRELSLSRSFLFPAPSLSRFLAHGLSLCECVAVCYSVLQCVAVCCSVLQCAAACCSVLQCVAVCCSVLQCDREKHNVQRHDVPPTRCVDSLLLRYQSHLPSPVRVYMGIF